MKTITELLELVSKAIEKTNKYKSIEKDEKQYNVFFVSFSGHVNQISIEFYYVYESKGDNTVVDRCKGYLDNESHVQELYYFLKNRV